MINERIIRQFSHCDAGKQINMNLIISLKCSLNDVLPYLVSSSNSTVGRLLYKLQGLSFYILCFKGKILQIFTYRFTSAVITSSLQLSGNTPMYKVKCVQVNVHARATIDIDDCREQFVLLLVNFFPGYRHQAYNNY